MSDTIRKQKIEMRKQYRKIRKNIDKSYADYAAEKLASIFIENIDYIKGNIIAAYIPMDGEIDVIPLMSLLDDSDYEIVIPLINKVNDDLMFHRWKYDKEILIPDTIITPIVAFDNKLNRLGFGGGWYDKTIGKLRHTKRNFIGVAYEAQHSYFLPQDEHDQALDIIITEKKIRVGNVISIY
ncbi:5-formyltetrahydrofolate cyclo-ligase [Wolbachia endosymbiont of Pentidionis agamae]|uniref:5-formyltetrahydrofolate cyclo-ligase n=1 Tax=Wolbachia endosymbiont of Pentidionis agamae TaxID=3110435 RepID=UPI002FD75713